MWYYTNIMIIIAITIFLILLFLFVIFLYDKYKKYIDTEKINWYTNKIIDIPLKEAKKLYPECDYKYLEFGNTYDSLEYIDKNNLYNEDIHIICETLIEVYLIINRRKEVKKEDILKRIENAERELQEAKKELENYKEGQRRWFPNSGGIYFRLSNDGNVIKNRSINENQTKADYDFGNCYRTKEDAQKAAERQQVKTMLEDIALELNAGEVIDWKNFYQDKCRLCYDYGDDCLEYEFAYSTKIQGAIYCLNDNFLEVAIKRIGKAKLENYIKGE